MSEFATEKDGAQRMLSVREAAGMAGVTIWKIYGWARRKSGLRVRREQRRIYIAEIDLLGFMRARGFVVPELDLEEKPAIVEVESASMPMVEAEPAVVTDLKEDFRGKLGSSGQREMSRSPRRLGGHAFVCVPEWIA